MQYILIFIVPATFPTQPSTVTPPPEPTVDSITVLLPQANQVDTGEL